MLLNYDASGSACNYVAVRSYHKASHFFTCISVTNDQSECSSHADDAAATGTMITTQPSAEGT